MENLPHSDDTVEDVIVWFHHILKYPGKQRLKDGMYLFHHPNLHKNIMSYDSETSQLFKTGSRAYAHLPARQVRGIPWQQVDVDLIGPWSVTTGTGKTYVFHALTCIDRITNLPKLIRINDKSSEEVAAKFEECWLS